MQFKEGASVYTPSGDKVGDIERFVLDPHANEIIGLIVRKGFLFTEDKVIPIEMVKQGEEDEVVLRENAGDPDTFPNFEEKHYVSPSEVDLRNEQHYAPRWYGAVYYYPPLGTASWRGAVIPPARPTAVERNIPQGTVALKEGANVISRDGEHIGDVERIFTDPKTDEVTHIAITQGLLFQEEKLLPADWVDVAKDTEIRLAVGKETLEKLGDF